MCLLQATIDVARPNLEKYMFGVGLQFKNLLKHYSLENYFYL
jgi:hypothetical protein